MSATEALVSELKAGLRNERNRRETTSEYPIQLALTVATAAQLLQELDRRSK